MKQVYGTIRHDGAILYGAGRFDVNKVSTGVYEITIRDACAETPVVFVTPVDIDLTSRAIVDNNHLSVGNSGS